MYTKAGSLIMRKKNIFRFSFLCNVVLSLAEFFRQKFLMRSVSQKTCANLTDANGGLFIAFGI